MRAIDSCTAGCGPTKDLLENKRLPGNLCRGELEIYRKKYPLTVDLVHVRRKEIRVSIGLVIDTDRLLHTLPKREFSARGHIIS